VLCQENYLILPA